MCHKLWMKDGKHFIENKQYKEAENTFLKVIDAVKKTEENVERTLMLAEAYNNLGFINYKKVEFCKAVEYYNKAIQFNSAYGIAYYNRGTIYYRLGLYDTAVEDMKKALSLDPDNKEFKIGFEHSECALKLTSD